jgi:hypothetical protein
MFPEPISVEDALPFLMGLGVVFEQIVIIEK